MNKPIEYVEVTEKRYNDVNTRYKYRTIAMLKPTKYYIARNRWSLEQKLC